MLGGSRKACEIIDDGFLKNKTKKFTKEERKELAKERENLFGFDM